MAADWRTHVRTLDFDAHTNARTRACIRSVAVARGREE